MNLPSFCHHVRDIGLVVTELEMARIHARRIIAGVQNMLANWDRSMGTFPRDTMGINESTEDSEFAVTA